MNPQYIVTTFDILLEGVSLNMIKNDEALKIVNEMEERARFIYNKYDFKHFINLLKNC